MFQPNLSLFCEPDGEHTLHAVTICPSSSYSAGRAHVGVPPTVRLTAGTAAVILPLRTRSGPALQVLTPVRHRLRNLELASQGQYDHVSVLGGDGDGANIPVEDVH